MKKLHFKIDISAPKEKVWDVLWGNETYPEWTSVFSEGSHAVTDWKEGSKVLFLSADKGGMYSRIEKKVPHEMMSFTHLGVVKDGKEQPQDEETRKWSGAKENYILNESGKKTELNVDIDITEEYDEMFRNTFPKALEKVKDLSEQS